MLIEGTNEKNKGPMKSFGVTSKEITHTNMNCLLYLLPRSQGWATTRTWL